MDASFNGTPGLGLPSPSAAQPGDAMQPAQGQAVALSAPSDKASDDLDQEWVSKAKAIVERTKDDPYSESIELTKMKAEYLRTRHNRHIKAGD